MRDTKFGMDGVKNGWDIRGDHLSEPVGSLQNFLPRSSLTYWRIKLKYLGICLATMFKLCLRILDNFGIARTEEEITLEQVRREESRILPVYDGIDLWKRLIDQYAELSDFDPC